MKMTKRAPPRHIASTADDVTVEKGVSVVYCGAEERWRRAEYGKEVELKVDDGELSRRCLLLEDVKSSCCARTIGGLRLQVSN